MDANNRIEKLTILVVIYNKNVSESETLCSIVSAKESFTGLEINLIIWDNSMPLRGITKAELDSLEDALYGFCFIKYISCPSNAALSRVYDSFFLMPESQEATAVIIFDHDTKFTGQYISDIRTALSCPEGKNVSLFAPRVYSHGVLVSPFKYVGFRGSYVDEITGNKVPIKYFAAINSGLCIRVKALKERWMGFPNWVHSYGTDLYFFLEVRKFELEIYVLDVKLDHELTFSPLNKDKNAYLRALEAYLHFLVKLIRHYPSSLIPIGLNIIAVLLRRAWTKVQLFMTRPLSL